MNCHLNALRKITFWMTCAITMLFLAARETAANPQRNISGTYIVGIEIVYGKGAACPAGFNRFGMDLNQGVGGEFIYLCLKYDPNPAEAVTDIRFVEGQGANPEPGFTIIRKDLNKGASGAYVYLTYTRDRRFRPLRNISLWSAHDYKKGFDWLRQKGYSESQARREMEGDSQEILLRNGWKKCFTNLNKDTGKPDTEIYLFKNW